VTQGPTSPTKSTSATFRYTDLDQGVGFRCSLDGSPFASCPATGTTYRGLGRGTHTFRVEAASGSVTSPVTVFTWSVTASTPPVTAVPHHPTTATPTATPTATTAAPGGPRPSAQTGVRFTVSNLVTPPLYPGVSQRLDLVFTNPNPSPITIAPRAVSITVSTSRAGCSTAVNFAVTQGLTSSVTVPANQTRSLDDLGVGETHWPVITMVDTPSSQDACQGAPLTLHYSAGGSG
jgi:hypothetical protein